MAIVTAQDVSRVFPMPAGPVTKPNTGMTTSSSETCAWSEARLDSSHGT